MTVDTSGKWWVGTGPDDIREFLEAYTEDEHPSEEFRVAKCQCGSIDFELEADDEEGAARRVCAKCGAAHFICDSEPYWEEAQPRKWECVECASSETNIGVGFSLFNDKQAINRIYIGVRCARCGILGYFSGWKINYERSLDLMEKV